MDTSLVILAAGIGSRFGGGVKQIAPVGPHGEIIIDYSIRDALEAGFNKVVFIIRHDLEKDFKEVIGHRIEKLCPVSYVYQETDDLPCACAVTERTKPWGTTHALWVCRHAVKEPFLIINADDYYGKEAYRTAHDFLVNNCDEGETLSLGMVGFVLKNTLSDNGTVTRGICRADANGYLTEVEETYRIGKTPEGVASAKEDGGQVPVNPDAIVSMNMWCFTPRVFEKTEAHLKTFLQALTAADSRAEHVLPTLVAEMLCGGEARVKVLASKDTWVGVTYQEDRPYVEAYFRDLIARGVYPTPLYR